MNVEHLNFQANVNRECARIESEIVPLRVHSWFRNWPFEVYNLQPGRVVHEVLTDRDFTEVSYAMERPILRTSNA